LRQRKMTRVTNLSSKPGGPGIIKILRAIFTQ
jgi:hypothetical protein